MPPTLADLAAALAPLLDAGRYAREGDPAGVWVASDRPVRRLGLRLDPGSSPGQAAGRAPYDWLPGDVDALLVHRPFGLWPARLPAGLGVVAVHRALDDRFSTGHNPALARSLGLALDPEPLVRDGARIGMTGQTEAPYAEVAARLDAVFGGHDAPAGPEPEGAVGRVAVAGAMTEALVLEAAARGATVYVTGQLRQPAAEAVRRTGVRAVAVGQGRAERWGLRHLGGVLAAAFPGLDVVDLDGPL
jgi:putative NIF3 family GTP cyclohydrolase 1 type 2